ncbi:hypothetical protein QTP88_023579 [Uroleucon formosanum]
MSNVAIQMASTGKCRGRLRSIHRLPIQTGTEIVMAKNGSLKFRYHISLVDTTIMKPVATEVKIETPSVSPPLDGREYSSSCPKNSRVFENLILSTFKN